MIITTIEAFELHDADARNISKAFLHAPQKDLTMIKFINEQVDILCKIDKKQE